MANYFNSLKVKKSKFGLSLYAKVETLIAEIQKNEKNGYINLEINERKEVGKYGETHSVTINDFEPRKQDLPI